MTRTQAVLSLTQGKPGLEVFKHSKAFATTADGVSQAGTFYIDGKADRGVAISHPNRELIKITDLPNAITKLQFNSRGTLLLGQQYRQDCHLWNATDGARIALAGRASRCAFLPGTDLVLLDQDGAGVGILNPMASRTSLLPASGGHRLHGISRDAQFFFTTQHNGKGSKEPFGAKEDDVWIWNLPGKTPFKRLSGHTDSVMAIDSSSQVGVMATGGHDKSIRLWTYPQGNPIRTLVGHTDSVVELTFSPDGKYLASASWDKRFIIWNVADGALVHTGPLSEHDRHFAFSPSGEFFVYGSGYDATKNNHSLSAMRMDSKAVASLRGYLGTTPAFGNRDTFVTRAGTFIIN